MLTEMKEMVQGFRITQWESGFEPRLPDFPPKLSLGCQKISQFWWWVGGVSLFICLFIAVRGSVNMPVSPSWLELADREREGLGPSFFSKKSPGCGFPRLV